jgi:hypothetical protein
MRSNRTVETDTQQQGAVRRRLKSCTLRPLAATHRLPLRWIALRRIPCSLKSGSSA